ncbi:cytochrome c biogenesis protein ResB [Derxia gummosa]|uniref:Cytochrome c biogenesis protein ResB n=1 Tax=Derxia gummosa DSM 723 TaxID=1121388 RepID=A0A9U5C5V4_9BURK|nr:cytochrome c biogenesis protein ResB [Derxia gummosa]
MNGSVEPASPATTGLQVRSRSAFVRDSVELLSSMRFAISVLTVIAIASVIGTVIQQNQPPINYLNQFGPFWAELFKAVGLTALYTTGWFYVLLTFLVISTTLCIIRNAPRFLRDMRDMRDRVRENSLRAFHHRIEGEGALAPTEIVRRAVALLRARGFKAVVREGQPPVGGSYAASAAGAPEGGGAEAGSIQAGPVVPGQTFLIAAKAGSANRLGYIAAHAAIVVMAVGYLLDTNLPIRMQMWFSGKAPIQSATTVSEVPASARFGPANLSFRGDVLIPEGEASDVAVVPYRDALFLQDLPFSIALKKFSVAYYPTGMPREFKSEVVVTDKDTGAQREAEIKVNEPLIHRGTAIYQSSFEDGGSRLKLVGWPMRGARAYTFDFAGEVGQSAKLGRSGAADTDAYQVEFSGFRAINVENLADGGEDAADTEKRFQDHVAAVVSSTTRGDKSKNLHNVGPSVQYKLRDKAGQAREFSNYMLPIELEGRRWFLAGVRDTPGEPFRYLRIPADDDMTVREFMRLRAAVQDPELRRAAAERFATRSFGQAGGGDAQLRAPLQASAERALEAFARQGFQSVADFIQHNVPEAEREKAAGVFIKILDGGMWELWQLARERDKLAPSPADREHGEWLSAAVRAVSDAAFYNAPVLLMLDSFEQRQASVFQVTRAPGKNIVYLGCLLLVIGVFSMFYIRERRVWCWVAPGANGGGRLLMAMSATRRSLDFEREFATLSGQLAGATGIAAHPAEGVHRVGSAGDAASVAGAASAGETGSAAGDAAPAPAASPAAPSDGTAGAVNPAGGNRAGAESADGKH